MLISAQSDILSWTLIVIFSRASVIELQMCVVHMIHVTEYESYMRVHRLIQF